MGTSRKGHKTAKGEKARSVKPRSLPERELETRQAEAVRGGKINSQDIKFVRHVDSASP